MEGDPYILNADSEVGDIVWVNGIEGLVVQLPALSEADARAVRLKAKEYPAKKVVIATKNNGASTPDAYGEYDSFLYDIPLPQGWRVPSREELWALALIDDKEWKGNGWEWKIGNDRRSLFLPTAGMMYHNRELRFPEDTSFGAYKSNYYVDFPDHIDSYYFALRLDANGFSLYNYGTNQLVSTRPFCDMPE